MGRCCSPSGFSIPVLSLDAWVLYSVGMSRTLWRIPLSTPSCLASSIFPGLAVMFHPILDVPLSGDCALGWVFHIWLLPMVAPWFFLLFDGLSHLSWIFLGVTPSRFDYCLLHDPLLGVVTMHLVGHFPCLGCTWSYSHIPIGPHATTPLTWPGSVVTSSVVNWHGPL
jgi:hypothetical protein